MTRLKRLCPSGIPQHVIQRGNNRQMCFNGDEDRAAYAYWLHEFSVKFQVEIHAWIFMTNHVHLLMTPKQENAMNTLHSEYLQLGSIKEERMHLITNF